MWRPHPFGDLHGSQQLGVEGTTAVILGHSQGGHQWSQLLHVLLVLQGGQAPGTLPQQLYLQRPCLGENVILGTHLLFCFWQWSALSFILFCRQVSMQLLPWTPEVCMTTIAFCFSSRSTMSYWLRDSLCDPSINNCGPTLYCSTASTVFHLGKKEMFGWCLCSFSYVNCVWCFAFNIWSGDAMKTSEQLLFKIYEGIL